MFLIFCKHVVAVKSAAKAASDSPREAVEFSRTASSPELIAQRVQYFFRKNESINSILVATVSLLFVVIVALCLFVV